MSAEFDYSFIKKMGEVIGEGVLVYDFKADKPLYANNTFLKLFGLKQEMLSTGSDVIWRYVPAQDLKHLRKRSRELMKKGSVSSAEIQLRLPGKKVKHLSCNLMLLAGTDMVTAFVKDVSKSKAHEEYLIKYTAQKDIMLDMLTHNLSGPLQLSKDVIASLQKGYIENNIQDVSRLISIMQENTQQCIDIVNDFLKEEHYESAFTVVRKTRFDVVDKILIMLAKLKETNKEKVFRLHSENSLIVHSDAVKFFQIVHNILSNAIKFTDNKGEIDISVTHDKTFYEVHISDNGIGIPERLKPHLLSGTRSGREGLKGEKSKGLGLSIASRLTEIMGGTIAFESKENQGTTFYIKLPIE